MSWVCRVCSSNNEDGTDECFVCGSSRSAEEIRAEKAEKRRRLAEARAEKRTMVLSKIESETITILYNFTNCIFICSVAVASIVVLISVILKIYNHNLTDVIQNFLIVVERGKYNIVKFFALNLKFTILSLPNNFHYMGSNIQGLFYNAVNNIKFYFINNIVAIVQKIIYTIKLTVNF